MPGSPKVIPKIGQVVYIWPRASRLYNPERNHSGGLATVRCFSLTRELIWVSFKELPGLFYRWDAVLERQHLRTSHSMKVAEFFVPNCQPNC